MIDRIRRSARGQRGRARARRRAARDRRADGRSTSTSASRRRWPRTRACRRSWSIPRRSLENSNAVQNRLASLRPTSRFAERQKEASIDASATPPSASVAIPGVKTPSLPELGPAPDFTDTQDWFNTPGDRPLTLAGLRGHVVLVDFWTYTCINCIRTLPFLKGLYAHVPPLRARHRRRGDAGVHVRAGGGQRPAGDPARTASHYPVVQDNHYGTWNAYQNQYWPAEYFIDAKGQVRHTQFGEGDYKQDEAAVRAAAGRRRRQAACRRR